MINDFINSNNSNKTVASNLTGNGYLTWTINKTLTLTGNNSYNGKTSILLGTIKAGSTTAFSNNSAVTVSNNATLDLAGYNNSIGSLAGSGLVIDSSATAATLTTNSNNTSTTFYGAIQNSPGVVSLTKNGTGVLTLTSNTHTYTGVTTINNGGILLGNGVGPYTLSSPNGIAIDYVNHRLFATDANNNRILVFALDSTNKLVNKTPIYVIGQPNLKASTAAVTQTGLNTAFSLAYDSVNQRLFVTDSSNNRVLVYNVATITNGMAASYVIGQTNFTTGGAATTQIGLNTPRGIAYDSANQRLFVSEASNNRVTVFNVATITNGMAASYVIGQATFTTAGAATSQTGLNSPQRCCFDSNNNRLFVSETANNRVTVFNTTTITNGMAASYVLGQTLFTTATGAVTQSGFNAPRGIYYDTNNNRLFVSQNSANRVTVFNVAPGTIANGMNASYVLGQASFITSAAATSQSGMSSPFSAAYDTANNYLYVMDSGNNRDTIFNVAPGTIANGMNAIDVIGQYVKSDGLVPDYTYGAANGKPTSIQTSSSLTIAGGSSISAGSSNTAGYSLVPAVTFSAVNSLLVVYPVTTGLGCLRTNAAPTANSAFTVDMSNILTLAAGTYPIIVCSAGNVPNITGSILTINNATGRTISYNRSGGNSTLNLVAA